MDLPVLLIAAVRVMHTHSIPIGQHEKEQHPRKRG